VRACIGFWKAAGLVNGQTCRAYRAACHREAEAAARDLFRRSDRNHRTLLCRGKRYWLRGVGRVDTENANER
jgi:hypothetical protein